MSATDVYETTIGLEIHVELSTASKMFCGCAVAFAGEPNSRTCPVCLGLPGALPVPNEKAVEYTIAIGLALGCDIASHSLFHRKNYFYPDMPKNYQISQYDLPLAFGGHVELDGMRVGITRVHLEEDTGKTTHVGGTGRIADADYSLVDFNRAGTPLVEIVTDPDLRSPEQARMFVAELRAICESLGVSDVRMEEGSLRVDANISVRRTGETEHGAKVEIKNMNSLRSLARALDYEERRQRGALESGETLIQETRHFDERSGATSSMRTKEYAFDYRYFPEPDLVPFEPSSELVESIRSALPEPPAVRRRRFASQYGLAARETEILTTSARGAAWFERAAAAYGGDPKKVANWIMADLFGLLNEAGLELWECKIRPEQLAAMITLIDEGTISGTQAKAVLAGMFETGQDPRTVTEKRGLRQMSDESTIAALIDEVIAANPAVVDKIRSGNPGPIGFLVGEVMKKTHRRANAGVVNQMLRQRLAP